VVPPGASTLAWAAHHNGAFTHDGWRDDGRSYDVSGRHHDLVGLDDRKRLRISFEIHALRRCAAYADAQRADSAKPSRESMDDLEFISHLRWFVGMGQKPESASASSFVRIVLSNVGRCFSMADIFNFDPNGVRPVVALHRELDLPCRRRRPQAGRSGRTVAWQVVRLRSR
jgi:hypothetical protein